MRPTRARTIGLALLAACGGRHVESSAVSPASEAAPIPPLEAATISMPITIALSALRPGIDKQLPPNDSLDQAKCLALGGAVCHQYVYHRDTLDLRMDGNRFALYSRIRYRARIALPALGGIGSCGYDKDPLKRADLRFATTLGWREDWRLAPQNTAISADLLDPCRMTLANVDATPLMRRVIDGQLASLRETIDQQIPLLADVRPATDSLWRTLQQPVALDTGVWLVMAPEIVAVAPLSGNGATVTTAVQLVAHPRVVLGAKPPSETRPLPKLTQVNPTSGIHVPVEIEIPFADVSQRVSALLAAQTADKDTRVSAARISGAGDTAFVQLDIAGSLTGSFHLRGRVRYDTTTRTLVLEDLQYGVSTSGALNRVKSVLGAYRIRNAVNAAVGAGKWNVGARLDQVRDQLSQQLNRQLAPGVSLAGNVTRVELRGIHTTAGAFVIRVAMAGEARLSVR
ncbi:MAG: DUF4403 family protein [Gemmatimonadota bacterium]|nr:DUF4403 family protein [Gemmatimonadota bacterium]